MAGATVTLLSNVAGADAQTNGSLSGTISDQHKGAVAGATVTLLSNVAGADAQTNGSLSGTISDQHKGAVAGATVTLLSNVAGAERTAVSDSNGAFDFQALLPGTYTISVEATGFKKAIARDIVGLRWACFAS